MIVSFTLTIYVGILSCLKLPLLPFVIVVYFHAVLIFIFISFMQIVHGNQSCSGHVVSFLFQAYRRALPVYLPVYLIPALIVHRQDLLKRLGNMAYPYLPSRHVYIVQIANIF